MPPKKAIKKVEDPLHVEEDVYSQPETGEMYQEYDAPPTDDESIASGTSANNADIPKTPRTGRSTLRNRIIASSMEAGLNINSPPGLKKNTTTKSVSRQTSASPAPGAKRSVTKESKKTDSELQEAKKKMM